uniref:VWFA domain-containing protein n=1 Tax=Magallana gigas TaxID=29159 RepID=A0A8W8HWS0_MAGGI
MKLNMESRVVNFIVLLTVVSAIHVSGSICQNKMADVVFLLDSSFSVWESDFAEQLKFVKSVVDNFQVGKDGIQVGVLSYSSEIQTNFFLNEYNDKEAIKSAVDKIQYLSTAGTDTAGALKYAREVMFHKKHGGRELASKIIILITDGMSHDSNATAKQAEKTKQAEINILAVAVGAPIMRELEMVASYPTTDSVFNVTDFSALPSIVQSLATTTCLVPDVPRDSEKTDTTTVSVVEDKIKKYCEKTPSDILFLIDSSSSIWPLHFRDIVQFTLKVIDLFDVSPNKTRIGVTLYSDDVKPVLHLDNQLNSKELKNTISNIHQLKGGTETGKALKHARENEFNENYSRKTAASKVIILLTDGQSIRPEDTLTEAKKLKEENITVFVIGIGNRTDREELKTIASSARHQYNLQDYNALSTIKNMLVVKTCTVHFQFQDSANDDSEETCWDTPRDVMFVYDSPAIGIHRSKIIRKAITEYREEHDSRDVIRRSAPDCTHQRLFVITIGNRVASHAVESLCSDFKHRCVVHVSQYNSLVQYVPDIMDMTRRYADRSQETKGRKHNCIVIGIGNRTDREELKTIASSARHQYNLQDYNALSTIKNMLVVKTCTVHFQFQDSANETLKKLLGYARDVMFVYDSPAIGIHRSKIIRKAITEMYKLMLIGSNKTRAVSFLTMPNRFRHWYTGFPKRAIVSSKR